jgi:glutamate---cysteine ligase / carboxylate-amine ligase
MQDLPFKPSKAGTIGVELELQIVDNDSFKLSSWAKEILDHFDKGRLKPRINHEITQGMIEINTSPHDDPDLVLEELLELQHALLTFSGDKGFSFCGGGTHPFQDWHDQEIFPDERYERVLDKFQFLCKQATIFGQHVHIGCATPNEAIYLTHALAKYTPQLIAMSASSPFYQSIDSGFYSSRTTQFNAFPICGHMPNLKDWDAFLDYFFHLRELGLIESMKDVYWDVRPKPEFGTVEVRILDTPLTLQKAASIGAFIQALSLYLIAEKPIHITDELYYLYGSNRFQASRYGLQGHSADGDKDKDQSIKEDLIDTFSKIQPYSDSKGTGKLLKDLKSSIIDEASDATLIRTLYSQYGSLPKVVEEQCKIWLKQGKV